MKFFNIFKNNTNDDIKLSIKVSTKNESEIINDISVTALFSEVIKTAIPSNNGLYPHEILMLNYAHSYNTGNNIFQKFWEYKYYVDNPKILLESLLKKGFLELGDIKNTLKMLKLPKIKEELKNYGLKQSGKKEELIERLTSSENITEIEAKFTDRYYQPTSLGEEELENNKYIIYIHRNSNCGIDIWGMNLLVNQEPKLPFRDKLWGFFNKESTEHARNKNYGFYRNTRLEMCKFLIEENKYKTALMVLFEVIYYDLSGLRNNEDRLFDESLKDIQFEQKLELNFPYESSAATIPPGIIELLKKMQNELKIPVEELKNIFLQELLKFSTIFHLFTKEECGEILIAELERNEKKLKEMYAVSEKRLIKLINN